MSTYAIGDLQGCAASFDALLEHVRFDPSRDRVWLVGDLVNRGPDSLGALRRVAALGDLASVVLGNHDLHLLAVSAGVRKAGRGDTLADILDAPDAHQLLDWLRSRRLAHRASIAGADMLMVHAGVLPGWSADDTMARARELETALRGPAWRETLAALFGNEPDAWHDELTGADRLRVIVNALTRLRFCSADGRIDFKAKDAPALTGSSFPRPPEGFMPWFDVPARRTRDALVVVGHWSTLGLLMRVDDATGTARGVIALDTGCVWGGALTAVRLEDRAVFQVPCPQAMSPG